MKKYITFVSLLVATAPLDAVASTATCVTPVLCEEMGYTLTAHQCKGIAALKCPFDDTKLFCKTQIPTTCPTENAKYNSKYSGCISDKTGDAFIIKASTNATTCEVVSSPYQLAGPLDKALEYFDEECRNQFDGLASEYRLATADEIQKSILNGNSEPAFYAPTNVNNVFVMQGNAVVETEVPTTNMRYFGYCYAKVPCSVTSYKNKNAMELCKVGEFYSKYDKNCFKGRVNYNGYSYITARGDVYDTIIDKSTLSYLGGSGAYTRHYAAEHCGGEDKIPTVAEYKALVAAGDTSWITRATTYVVAKDGCIVYNKSGNTVTIQKEDCYDTMEYYHMCKTAVSIAPKYTVSTTEDGTVSNGGYCNYGQHYAKEEICDKYTDEYAGLPTKEEIIQTFSIAGTVPNLSSNEAIPASDGCLYVQNGKLTTDTGGDGFRGSYKVHCRHIKK